MKPKLAAALATARAAWRARFCEPENRRPLDRQAANGLTLRAATSADTAEILLYDEIGYWGVTAKDFAAALAKVTAPNVTLRINSPGGDVFDGLAIYAALQSHPATITAVIEGLAASAASFIALAAAKVQMAPNAFMMIHRAWGIGIGNAADMRDMATVLDKIDGQLAAIYAAKSGAPAAEMQALMAGDVDGTWFTADEAKSLGLIDQIGPDEEQSGETEQVPDPDPEGPQDRAALTVAAMRRRLRLEAVTL